MEHPLIGPCGHTHDRHEIENMVQIEKANRVRFQQPPMNQPEFSCSLCRQMISTSSLYRNLVLEDMTVDAKNGRTANLIISMVHDVFKKEYAGIIKE